MVFGFLKKLIKHYIDKFIDWMRMVKFDLELETQIKKYHEDWVKKNTKVKPKVIEKGTFGEDGWSISIGHVNDKDTKN
tara:strand:- start:223 stop:456 length:234 start_codon:yes stop_codon:yes gene_type:complete